ncbi:methylated-DNA--[protein]-cysteine S-methyltransferase [Salinicola halimionae]|uniref:methylated-DNA--[protein]-cysteine S-methyltransferase n=1 Tax=Salinicola halimionae TaxID=1949081 RepID=UPI000DA1F945|nr:methylated-DNA--[protein]-cysteine S-methyltransferase [Salinicola halimionae]
MKRFLPFDDPRLPARHDDYVHIYHPPASTPLGPIVIRATDHGLTWLAFSNGTDVAEQTNAITERCAEQLEAYFRAELTVFDLPLAPRGTDFQIRVWQVLQAIPFGQTRSYREIAVAIGTPLAVRAVGAANGRNPLSLIVPCHRVIGSNGKLTGYAGGLDRKRWLLQHEVSILQRSS